MVCEYCYGKGERGSIEWRGVKICPECQGSGIVSCCDTAGATGGKSECGAKPHLTGGSDGWLIKVSRGHILGWGYRKTFSEASLAAIALKHLMDIGFA